MLNESQKPGTKSVTTTTEKGLRNNISFKVLDRRKHLTRQRQHPNIWETPQVTNNNSKNNMATTALTTSDVAATQQQHLTTQMNGFLSLKRFSQSPSPLPHIFENEDNLEIDEVNILMNFLFLVMTPIRVGCEGESPLWPGCNGPESNYRSKTN